MTDAQVEPIEAIPEVHDQQGEAKDASAYSDLAHLIREGKSKLIGVSQIVPSPINTRRYFDPEALASLAASLRAHGQLQPIVVRQVLGEDDDFAYEIIAGERRYRAAELIGLPALHAFVISASDRDMRKLMLTENLQRDDITPWEELTSVLAVLIDVFEEARGWPALVQASNGDTNRAAAKVVRLAARTLPEPPRAAAIALEMPVDELTQTLTETFSVGIGLTTFARYRLSLLNWPLEVRDALNDGALVFAQAAVVATIGDEELRRDFLARAVAGAFPSVERLRETLKAATTPNVDNAAPQAPSLARRLKRADTRLGRIEAKLNTTARRRIEKLLRDFEEALDRYEAKLAATEGRPSA